MRPRLIDAFGDALLDGTASSLILDLFELGLVIERAALAKAFLHPGQLLVAASKLGRKVLHRGRGGRASFTGSGFARDNIIAGSGSLKLLCSVKVNYRCALLIVG